LNVENQDLFGDELNIASKLGEDIADMGQVLLTPAAAKAMEGMLELVEHSVNISGLSLRYFELPK
jgi:adenylate cyclase